VGSTGKLAAFKARVINDFVSEHAITSIIEFGCGDGMQLQLAKYKRYTGFDVSETAVSLCQRRFCSDQSKTFKLMKDYRGEHADVALSLDVLYHLVEDAVFESYLRVLFDASDRYVIIYSSNRDWRDESEEDSAHVRHRKFDDWITRKMREWVLMKHVLNEHPYRGDYRTGSFADFYIYRRLFSDRR
jgi:hypothetical protein